MMENMQTARRKFHNTYFMEFIGRNKHDHESLSEFLQDNYVYKIPENWYYTGRN